MLYPYVYGIPYLIDIWTDVQLHIFIPGHHCQDCGEGNLASSAMAVEELMHGGSQLAGESEGPPCQQWQRPRSSADVVADRQGGWDATSQRAGRNSFTVLHVNQICVSPQARALSLACGYLQRI